MSFTEKIKKMMDSRPKAFQAALTIVIILIAVIVFAGLMGTRKKIGKRTASIPMPKVRTITAHVGPQRVRITGEGTVTPLREINLVPQVGGKVVFIDPALADGGEFVKDDTLLRIDPVDYKLGVKSAEARVRDLESRLMLAVEESEAAREEWSLQVGEKNGAMDSPPPLVAKEPQLAAARAALDGGRAELEKARLNLERTSILAPFDGRISSKAVDLGQFVSTGQSLGRMFSTEAAEITVPLVDEDLSWINVPGFTENGDFDNEVTVAAVIGGIERSWPARLMRAEGRIDERTRMVGIIVRVENPYQSKPPLAMGLFVTVRISGRTIPNSVWLPRTAIRENDRVWIVDNENRVRFRDVEIARYDGDEVLVGAGIADGELVVISRLDIVTGGMQVRHEPVKEPAR